MNSVEPEWTDTEQGQREGGGFGVHPYQKWIGAHWRLVSLAELGFPKGDPRAEAAANHVLDWLTSDAHLQRITLIKGRWRQHASQEGNAVGACSRLGLAGDPRVRRLVHSLLEWQWPDGGWNCDKNPQAIHSSFMETLLPLRGLALHARHGRRAHKFLDCGSSTPLAAFPHAPEAPGRAVRRVGVQAARARSPVPLNEGFE